MPDNRDRRGRQIRYEELDQEFQRRWSQARRLGRDQVERAFRHGFDARYRFAERPFYEVEDYLRESWEAMSPAAPWVEVADLVRAGYERYRGASLDYAADLGPEAETRFGTRTEGGSHSGARGGGPVPRADEDDAATGGVGPAAGAEREPRRPEPPDAASPETDPRGGARGRSDGE